ncbi:PucR family transcriptional regulator [Nocardia sp. NPDC051570]|uniref:PucR family transcriptional regulator n=1 Tax=Nocardia sp. NPDC051570 TaxID=3364324 RepID=UPI0037A5374D
MGDDPHLIMFRVSGHLGPLALAAFPGMVAGPQGPDTVLTGLLPDRSALFGALAEIETLGLDLLEMRTLVPADLSSDRTGARIELLDALLHGKLFDRWSVREAADCLGLPATGPYAAIAAQAPALGAQALPRIGPKLRSLDIFSVWWQLPELSIGLASVRGGAQWDALLALLSRTATTRIGVSPRFDDLGDTARALRYARIALRGHADPDARVTVFDGSILGSAAVCDPEVTTKLVAPLLDSFTELADEERELLFETFRIWVETDGSLRAAGELLFCHPNTVRYRLHRIEERTGRSLSRPRDLAELCFAFEVHRRLL